jgi:hypothetical protein
MVQFGPGDYGISIGKASATYAGGLHPEVKEAREFTIRKTLEAGLRPRAEILSVDEVEYYTDLGVIDFNISSDLVILKAFYAREGRALRARVAELRGESDQDASDGLAHPAGVGRGARD